MISSPHGHSARETPSEEGILAFSWPARLIHTSDSWHRENHVLGGDTMCLEEATR